MLETPCDLVDPSDDRRHPVRFQFQSEKTRRPLNISRRNHPSFHEGLLVTGFRLFGVGFHTQPADTSPQLTGGQLWGSIEYRIGHLAGGLLGEMVGAVNNDAGPRDINITTMQQLPH